jgi:formylglycine-generating enzyme required for sulfatase activity
VKSFKASKMLVSNAEYVEFVEAGGYSDMGWWTNEGQRWLAAIKPKMPLFWHHSENKYQLRTIFRMIDMPWDWPV